MAVNFVELPSPADAITSTRDFSIGYFTSFLPFTIFIVALSIAVIIGVAIRTKITGAISHIADSVEKKDDFTTKNW